MLKKSAWPSLKKATVFSRWDRYRPERRSSESDSDGTERRVEVMTPNQSKRNPAGIADCISNGQVGGGNFISGRASRPFCKRTDIMLFADILSDDQLAILGCFGAMAMCGLIASLTLHFGPVGQKHRAPSSLSVEPQESRRTQGQSHERRAA